MKPPIEAALLGGASIKQDAALATGMACFGRILDTFLESQYEEAGSQRRLIESRTTNIEMLLAKLEATKAMLIHG